ncbi:MAG: putative ABC transporter permease [Lactobacillales bacterium]|jgi:uncharacterized membrane protein|nr:putative ABC transporter permease [Lactobacillales bacterium]
MKKINFHKLGFARVVLVYFYALLIETVSNVMATSVTDFSYAWIGYTFDSIFLGLSIYFIHKQLNFTRWFIIIGIVVEIFMTAIILSIIVQYKLPMILTTVQINSPYLFLIALYFYFSKKVPERFCCTLDDQPEDEAEVKVGKVSIGTLRYWKDLLLYFFIFSILGQVMENVYIQIRSISITHQFDWKLLLQKGLTPAFPYGMGFVLCVILIHPIYQWLQTKFKTKRSVVAILFFVNMFVMSSVELICGLIGNRDYANWDYRGEPFNFMGQVCLRNAIGFGLVATIIVIIIYPRVVKFRNKMTPAAYAITYAVATIVYCAFIIYYLIAPNI